GDHAGEHERAEVDVTPARREHPGQPGAEDEQEQHWLGERRDDAHAVPEEADELSLPHHPHGSQVVDEPTAGLPNADDGGDVGRGHQRALLDRTHMLARLRSAPDASASRIVRPVYDMNTSSRVGRATRTEWIGTSSSSNSRGTNSSPFSTWKARAPSLGAASSPKCW